MASLNLCQFIGNVGKIETRYLPNGDPVTNLSLAVNESWKNKDTGAKEGRVEWVHVSMFGKLAEIAATYVTTGAPLYIAGKMRTRKYQDKDGQDRYTTEIRADEMQMLGKRETNDAHPVPAQRERDSNPPGRPGGPAEPTRQSAGGFADMGDDIPF